MLLSTLTFAVSIWLVKIVWLRVMLLLMLLALLIFMWRLPVVDLPQEKRR